MTVEEVEPRTGAEAIGWDLSDLYAGIDDPALEADVSDAEARAAQIAAQYRGRIAALNADEMLALIEAYEALLDQAYKTLSYARLHWTTNTEDPARGALLQKLQERLSRLQQETVFLTLEWANAPDAAAAALIDNPKLARYRHFLETARRYRPHLLSEPEEKILTEKRVTGRGAWSRFFNEVHSAARYEFDGERVPEQVVLSKLHSVDRDVRRRAAGVLTTGLKNLSRTTTYIFNTILADKASDDRLRNYPTWISARNLDNEVSDESVQALVEAVTSRYDIVARYYRLKRRLLDVDELFDYDRYAPLPAADQRYTWDEGRALVLDAYGQFHPRMAQIAEMFFEYGWIDAAVRPGKRGGAYSSSTVPSVHPYVFLNYQALPRDVMTLAHELGHGVHQYLAREQGILQADTPLTTAEMASTFGEALVFSALMARESDPQVRLAMLTGKLEDSFATVFRQVAMNRFEDAIHNARRREGELTTDQFCDLWLETQRAMFSDSVTLTDDYGIWWSYIPHFIDVPGYVYAYAFGELLVLALYARYQQAGAGFADGYIEVLRAGGSDWPHEIVKPLGVDLTDPHFWHEGLQILDDMVAQAEALAAQT
ncbi:MAG: M3 family oligoendopeptidase [Anaerolineae bacterium]